MVYSGPVASVSQPSPIATIRGPLTFGQSVSVGLLNGATDVRHDLLSATNTSAANVAFAIYQQGPSRPFAGTGAGVLGSSPEFWVSRFDATTLSGNSASLLGATNSIGDLDGNGQPDVILGDSITGIVKVWR